MFDKNDLDQYKIFDKLLSDKITFKDLTAADTVQIYRSLVWFANLRKKLEDGQFEITKVTHAPVIEEKPTKTKTK